MAHDTMEDLKEENARLRKQLQELRLQQRSMGGSADGSKCSSQGCGSTSERRASSQEEMETRRNTSFKSKIQRLFSRTKRLGSVSESTDSADAWDRSTSSARRIQDAFWHEQLDRPSDDDMGDRLLHVLDRLDPGWMEENARKKKNVAPVLDQTVLKEVLGQDDRACWATHWDDERGVYRLWGNRAAKMLFGLDGKWFSKRKVKKRILLTDAMSAQMQAVFWRARADFDEGVCTPRATFMFFYPGDQKNPVLLRTFVSAFRYKEPHWINKDEGVAGEGVALFTECVPQRLYSPRHQNILVRQHMMMKNSASPMTMFLVEEELKVCAMEQNPASMAFMGYLADDEMKTMDPKDAPSSCCDDDCAVVLKDDLENLFGSENLQLVAELLEDVRKGKRWVQRVKISSKARLPSCFTKNTGLYSRISTSDRDIWHEVAAIPTKDPVTGQKTVVVNQTDITDVVAAEARARSAAHSTKQLLRSLLPQHIIEKLMELGGGEGALFRRSATMMDRVEYLAEEHPSVTILFADIVGFTTFSQSVKPKQVMSMLNMLYDGFDRMIDEYDIYKVETIGDSYMVVGGLLECKDGVCFPAKGDKSHASRVVNFGIAMLEYASTLTKPDGTPIDLRVGVHSGACVSGIVGTKAPRYCLFGDTVNVASRMESTGIPGCIQASTSTRELSRELPWVSLGEKEIKGKGKMVTYKLQPSLD
eukprot:scaffold1314_cov386-Pavlova_lutheri.AAC.27